MSTIRVHCWITGEVQGVGYRFAATREAARLGLGGWAQNSSDGSVELECEGEEAAVQEFIAWCKRGSSDAAVDRCDVTTVLPRGDTLFTSR